MLTLFVLNEFIFKKLLVIVMIRWRRQTHRLRGARWSQTADSRQQTVDSGGRQSIPRASSAPAASLMAFTLWHFSTLDLTPDPVSVRTSTDGYHINEQDQCHECRQKLWNLEKKVLCMGEVVVRETFGAVSSGGLWYLHWSFHRSDRTKIRHSEVLGNRTHDLSTIETRYRSEIKLFRHGEVN